MLGPAFVGALYQHLDVTDGHLEARLAPLQSSGTFSAIGSGEPADKYLKRVRGVTDARDMERKARSARSRIAQLSTDFARAPDLRGPHTWEEHPKTNLQRDSARCGAVGAGAD